MRTSKSMKNNRSLGKKALDGTLKGAKYIGKNFWKVLPFGSGINYQIKKDKAIKENKDFNPLSLKNIAQERLCVNFNS